MRNRIVRTLTTEKSTEYKMTGFMITEKMKRDLRARGLKTDKNKWTDVFPNADIVYRFNPTKGKLDIFVGDVYQARYGSGKSRTLKPVSGFHNDVERANKFTTESHHPTVTTITVRPSTVSFGR